MPLNKTFFRLWVIDKINDLDKKIIMGYFNSAEEIFRAQGRLDMLKELYEDYNLEEEEKEDVKYHDQI